MIELNWTELSFGLSLFFNLLFLFFVVVYYKKYVQHPVWNRNKINLGMTLLALLLVIVVSVDGDWFSYQDLVWNYDLSVGAHNHGEPVYAYIISFVNKNYLLFRIIVWGGAMVLAALSFHRFEINVNVALFFLVAVFLIKFNYERASLAMACYFYGFSLFVKPIRKNMVITVILIDLSFFGAYSFHHSTIVLLFLTVVAFLPLEKPFVWIPVLILLPFMSLLMGVYFNLADFIDNEYVLNKYTGYLAETAESNNIFGVMSNIISYAAIFVPLVVSIIVFFKNRKNIDMSIVRLFRLTVMITIFASSFLFMRLNSTILFYRYLFMTMIPLTILSVYLYSREFISRKTFSVIFIVGAFSNFYKLLYCLYRYWQF